MRSGGKEACNGTAYAFVQLHRASCSTFGPCYQSGVGVHAMKYTKFLRRHLQAKRSPFGAASHQGGIATEAATTSNHSGNEPNQTPSTAQGWAMFSYLRETRLRLSRTLNGIPPAGLAMNPSPVPDSAVYPEAEAKPVREASGGKVDRNEDTKAEWAAPGPIPSLLGVLIDDGVLRKEELPGHYMKRLRQARLKAHADLRLRQSCVRDRP